MSKPTEGPYTYDEHGGTFYVWGRGHAMVADGDTDEGYVARMRGVGRGATVEEQRANAALLAASWDLREAAKHAAMEWRLHGQLTDSCRALEAAIAKAEGR